MYIGFDEDRYMDWPGEEVSPSLPGHQPSTSVLLHSGRRVGQIRRVERLEPAYPRLTAFDSGGDSTRRVWAGYG